MRLEIVGQENLNNISGSILLAANHTSELDPTVIPLALPFLSNSSPIYSVIYPFKKYKTPDFGWRKYVYGQFFFNILAGYPVYSGYKDYESSLKDHILLLKSGRTVCIFPEGKCTVDGKIAPAHGGLGFLTFETKATVVPLAINTFYGLTFFDFLLRRKKLTVTILPPMSTDELISTNSPTVEDFRAAGEKVLEKIKKKLEK